MIQRELKGRILKSLHNFPVVTILGSRQVGKTTLAKDIQKQIKRKSIYLDLELPSDLSKLNDPEFYLKQHQDKLVIIDEVQQLPNLFPLLRALIDQDRRNGRFLLLGSASPILIQKSSETLAGRIIYHELTPLNVQEVVDDSQSMQKLWLRGGYPQSYLAVSEEVSFEWRESFLKTHLERDIPQLGYRTPAPELHRFLMMMAHMNGQLLNVSQIANNLNVSAPTVDHYIDLFESTFIFRKLLPYHASLKKRLIKRPKLYIRDTGLLHVLLGQRNMENLYSHPGLGASWEGIVVEQIVSMIPNSWQYYFYRSASGDEIDLILVDEKRKIRAIEVKHSLTPTPAKGFWTAFNDLSCKQAYIVYPGDESYNIKENVKVISIRELKSILK